jgi:hypothetical protein
MRQVREVIRLKYLFGQSGHRIAAAIGISSYTVAEYLRRAAVRRVPVTLLLLWAEYRAGQPDRYGYSRYVAAKIMLRLMGRARNTADFPGSIHNIEEGDRRSTRPSRTPAMMAGWVPVAGLSSR